jgi:hypothetical protein
MITSDLTIRFTIKYQTLPGQYVAIYGSIPQLGEWKVPKLKLKWTEGHVWKGQLSVPENIENFEYKFVCESDNHKRWEDGMNRIFLKSRCKESELKEGTVDIECVWEHFYVIFNIFYPLNNEVEYLQIVGEPKELGCWLKDDCPPARMQLSDKKTLKNNDLDITGRFWEAKVLFSSTDSSNLQFHYRYVQYNPIKSK